MDPVETFLRGVFARLQADEAQIDDEWGPEDGFREALANDAPILETIAALLADAAKPHQALDPIQFRNLVASLRNKRLKGD